MDYKPGDRVQLSDGNTYTFILPIPLHNEQYFILSCEQNEDAFRLAKVNNESDKKTLTFTFDKKLLLEAKEYIKEHENEL